MNLLVLKYSRMFDRLPLAAKSITLAVVLGLIFIIWYYGFWQNLQGSFTTKSLQIINLEKSIPDAQARLKEVTKEIQGKLNMMNLQDKNGFAKPFSPNQGIRVLHEILKNTGGLELLQLESIPATEVMMPQSNQTTFEHGLTIKFQGDYFSTMRYLQSIERLKWKIFWDELDYKVTQFPLAEITLSIHTISNSGDWLHV